jgi:hypothetical protein
MFSSRTCYLSFPTIGMFIPERRGEGRYGRVHTDSHISLQGGHKEIACPPWLTNSALVYEPKCGWKGVTGSQPMSPWLGDKVDSGLGLRSASMCWSRLWNAWTYRWGYSQLWSRVLYSMFFFIRPQLCTYGAQIKFGDLNTYLTYAHKSIA